MFFFHDTARTGLYTGEDTLSLHDAHPIPASKLEALRLHPARLHVIRRGKVISETPEVKANVDLGDGPEAVDFR